MRTYEEFDTPKEKRAAQRGAQRGKATGKSRGYTLVFDEDGRHSLGNSDPTYDAIGELMAGRELGDPPHTITHCTPSTGYLRNNCRKVGFDSIPHEWQLALVRKLKDSIIQAWNEPYNARYRRLIHRVEVRYQLRL